MAQPIRRTASAPDAAPAGRSAPRDSSAPTAQGGEPAIPNDLVDVEAPAGAAIDMTAYVAPAQDAGAAAIPNDLVDVEAPALGGSTVDTAAYASGKAPRGRTRDAKASRADTQAPPPPAAAASEPAPPDVDPVDAEAGVAPVRAGPELGGAPTVGRPAAPDAGDVLHRAGVAALRLAARRPWPQVSLRDIAEEAGAPFADLYAEASSKPALLLALSTRLDRTALERIAGDSQPAARDRLFEAMMSRLEVMEPHRDALLAIGRSERLSLAAALPRTTRALLEGSGVATDGGRGALRLAAALGIWVRTLQVWRDDEGALNRTMAEIDKLLTRADKRLSRVGAGFEAVR